jgi:NADPH-dependent 2,4-dienoyl-CoA reductase/sulfur reductase-like enzyme
MTPIKNAYDIIIVGGGPASRILNKYLHMFQPEIDTLVIRDEDRIVNHCGTPYIVEGTIPWEKGLIPEKLVTQFGTPILVDPVVGGDPKARFVRTASGRQISYRKLVFATGTDQYLPPIPGIDLDRVLKVRRTEDVIATMEELRQVRHVTVLGAGYIGLEFAVALQRLGKRVSIVETAPHIMGGRIDEMMAGAMEAHLREMGIELHLGHRAISLDGDGRVQAVELENDTRFDTGAVLAAVGVRPLIDYAPLFGLDSNDDGILVDEYFATSVPGIYALGDCTATRSLVTGAFVPGKLGSNAGQMARYLALDLAGRKRPYPGVVNAVVTMVGEIAYGAAGITEADARTAGIDIILTSRNTSSSCYENMPTPHPVETKLVYHTSDLRLLGGELMGRFNPAGFIETLAQLIERRATLEEVVTMNYSSHPELTPKTSKPFFVWASEPLFKNLARTGRLGSSRR